MNNKWPLQSECMSFYGDPRYVNWYQQNVVSVPCPWPLRIGDTGTDHIHCHKKVADSLLRVLSKTWIDVGRDMKQIKAMHFDIYDGCYNLRAMRGGNRLSIHSYAAAIDFDAEHNPFNSKKFFFKQEWPLITNFLAEGVTWGGHWRNPDSMHFQWARVG